MFKIEDNPTFTHSVEAMVPVDGGHEKQSFKVTFQAMPTDDFRKFDLGTVEGSDGFLRAVVVGLGDIVGADGKPIPYSDGLRDKVIAMSWARKAITAGYFKAVAASAEGN